MYEYQLGLYNFDLKCENLKPDCLFQIIDHSKYFHSTSAANLYNSALTWAVV